MKRLMITLLLVGSLGLLSNPAPVDAAAAYLPGDETGANCLNGSIESCNSDFSGSGEKLVGIRGWCYIIRWGWCSWFD